MNSLLTPQRRPYAIGAAIGLGALIAGAVLATLYWRMQPPSGRPVVAPPTPPPPPAGPPTTGPGSGQATRYVKAAGDLSVPVTNSHTNMQVVTPIPNHGHVVVRAIIVQHAYATSMLPSKRLAFRLPCGPPEYQCFSNWRFPCSSCPRNPTSADLPSTREQSVAALRLPLAKPFEPRHSNWGFDVTCEGGDTGDGAWVEGIVVEYEVVPY
jgi:hypothetical protein